MIRKPEVVPLDADQCESCERRCPPSALVPLDWMEVVDTRGLDRPVRTTADLVGLPHRPARWCPSCVKDHARWKASQQRPKGEKHERAIRETSEKQAPKYVQASLFGATS